jgi:hypothetical protein
MSGARPIKMSYTPDQVMFAGFSDSTAIKTKAPHGFIVHEGLFI